MALKIYVKTYRQIDVFGRLEKEPESEKIIDHDDRSDRIWLGKHCFWAFRNGRHVQTGPVDRKELG